MPHAEFDDNFAEHPSNWALSDKAFRLHAAGILYANRYLTDGFIDADQVSRLIPRYSRRALDELLDRHKWVPCRGGCRIRDYLDHNPSADEVRARREQARKRKARSRQNPLTEEP